MILMGSKFEIAAIHDNERFALKVIDSVNKEIVRIEALISSWKVNSQTSLINANAGIAPVIVDTELFNLIKRAKKISVLTQGAFDISYASMDKVWKFDRRVSQMPTEDAIKASVAKINHEKIILNEIDLSVFLKDKGMRIGFGAIGKGYAANKARHLMIEMGIENGMLNAGGDLIAWGGGINNEKWKVGIADPKKQAGFISWLEIEDQAIVTSGDYERYLTIDGVRYSHIIDPRTGYPAKEIKSVTVICPDAELADGLATSVFVLGVKDGLKLIDQMIGFECIIVDDKDEFITSKGIELNLIDNITKKYE
ncbi:MAG TPA: FAD:protein FMN transferase [Bacteroidetes bacterium]|nr:FAD:protein FMN transferase [Bacteroidota bacterium]